MKKFPWDRHVLTRTYRYGKRKQTKIWQRKKSREKIGFMRYSSGPKWSGQFDYDKPAFWRKWQPELIEKVSENEMLTSGYTKNQAWVALCKSWNGFMNAQREGDRVEMKQYIGQIRRLQKDLGLPITEFDLFTDEEMKEIDDEFGDRKKELWYATTVP